MGRPMGQLGVFVLPELLKTDRAQIGRCVTVQEFDARVGDSNGSGDELFFICRSHSIFSSPKIDGDRRSTEHSLKPEPSRVGESEMRAE